MVPKRFQIRTRTRPTATRWYRSLGNGIGETPRSCNGYHPARLALHLGRSGRQLTANGSAAASFCRCNGTPPAGRPL